MKTAVFTNELREDLGFAAPLLCIADELVRLSAEVGSPLRTIFLLKDPIYCGHEVASHGHIVLPAPTTKPSVEIKSGGRSYANLLATIGFAHERELQLLVETWDRLFALLQPDLIVADSSPVACLAARGRAPVFVTGSGFSAPPANLAAFPAIAAVVETETNQSQICDAVNKVLQKRAVQPVANLPELFAGEGRAVFAVPPLDPYYPYRNEQLLDPSFDFSGPLAEAESPSVFVALPSTFPHLIGIVRGLERAGATISGYVPGPQTVGSTLLNEIGAHIFETRPRLVDVLSKAAVVLTVSPDVALAAYLAGRPQVLFRGDLEMSLMASELERRHSAIALETADAEKVRYALRELIDNRSYTQSAREEARRAQTFHGSIAIAARACLKLVKSDASEREPAS